MSASGAALTTTFTCAGLVFVAATGTTFGKARIYVDGVETDLVSLYSSTTLYKQAVLRKTLPYGTHTVKVEWTGTKNAKARATTINIDAIDVIAGAPAGPTPTQTLPFDAANRVVGFTYDARGNVLADGTYAYTWDAMNRLTGVKLATTGAPVASFAYDADGMRQVATVGASTTRFVVDSLTDEIVALLDSAGAVVAQFVRDAAGALVSMVKGGATFTYLTNAHGDVTALLDSAGTVVARWTYDAWGVPTEYNAAGTQVAVGTAGNPFLYAGYYYDTATGHYYLRARYYDPGTGRFLSMDPEPGGMTDRLSQNPYIYCQNDPVNNTDRTGRRIDALGHRARNRQEAEAERRAQKVANEARKKREAEARRLAAARAEADRKARAAMAAARVKEATAAKKARAEADRNARLGMDKARQAEGAATRERNVVYESVRSGQAMWDMALKGASNDQMRAYVNGVQASGGYQQWERGNEDAYAEYRQEVAERPREVASTRDPTAGEVDDLQDALAVGQAVCSGVAAASFVLAGLAAAGTIEVGGIGGVPFAKIGVYAAGASAVLSLVSGMVTEYQAYKGYISPQQRDTARALWGLNWVAGALDTLGIVGATYDLAMVPVELND